MARINVRFISVIRVIRGYNTDEFCSRPRKPEIPNKIQINGTEIQKSKCNLAPKIDTGPRSRLKAGLVTNW